MPTQFMTSRRPIFAASPRPEFQRLHDAVAVLRASILDYYDGDTAILDESPMRSHTQRQQLAARMALKVIEAQKKPGGVTFVIASVGSSMTAGHGAMGHTAFPGVLRRVLGPMFEVVGVKLETRNAGVGSEAPWPHSWCLLSQVGDDVVPF